MTNSTNNQVTKTINLNKEMDMKEETGCSVCAYNNTCTHMYRVEKETGICSMYADTKTKEKSMGLGSWVIDHMVEREQITTTIDDSGIRDKMWITRDYISVGQISYSCHDNKNISIVEEDIVESKGYIRMALAAVAVMPIVWVVSVIIALA